MSDSSFRKGVFFSVLSFVIWGILPLYWKTLAAVNSLHILAARIIFSLLLVSVILIAKKDFAWLAVYKNAKQARLIICAAAAVSANWGLYIWAINSGHVIDASLGYYINPLVSVALGLIFFREKLSRLQWAAFALAALGVAILTVLSGTFPWVSMLLAITFGLYGLLKKTIPLSGLESLAAETFAALPIGLFLIFFRFESGADFPRIIPSIQALSYLGNLPVHVLILLVLSGAATTVPLFYFSRGARLLPLSTLGFIQFLSPTIQFFLGIVIFGEQFPPRYVAAFACIWTAGIMYIISLRPPAGQPPQTKRH